MAVARTMLHGCDVWLNNPRRPLEACGTSGMKAALNGVLELQHPRRLVGRVLRRPQRLGDRLGRRRRRHRSPRPPRGAPACSVCSSARSSRCSTTATRRRRAGAVDRQDEGQLAIARAVRHRGPDGARLHRAALRARRGQRHAMLADDAARGKALAHWKQQVIEAWPGVKVVDLDIDTSPAHEGEQRSVRAQVELGALDVGQVTVQALHGPIDSAGCVHRHARVGHAAAHGQRRLRGHVHGRRGRARTESRCAPSRATPT